MTDKIKTQCELEFHMRDLGGKAALVRYEKAMKGGRWDEADPWQRWLKHVLVPVSQEIEARLTQKEQGVALKHANLLTIVADVGIETAVFLAAKALINALQEDASANAIFLKIGNLIEDELRFRDLAEHDEALFKRLKLRADKKTGYQFKRAAIKIPATAEGFTWAGLDLVTKRTLGSYLFDVIAHVTGDFTYTTYQDGNRKRSVIKLTEQAHEYIRDRLAWLVDNSPQYLPMIVPPTPWSNPWNGGYLTRAVTPLTLVKTGRDYLEEMHNYDECPDFYEAVNLVQSTAWQVNPTVLDAVRVVHTIGAEVGKIPPQFDPPLPIKPVDIETNEQARKSYNKSVAHWYSDRTSKVGQRISFSTKLAAFESYAGEPEIYFPHNADFRGRFYAAPIVNPQGADWMKGTIRFAEGRPIETEAARDWMYIHAANLWGKDKETFADRIKWTEENRQFICKVATDWAEDFRWTDADKPFEFLAIAEELKGFWENPEDFRNHVPIAVDGSCNGLQHFAAMLRCPKTAAAVNVSSSETVADVYMLVADQVLQELKTSDNPIAAMWLAWGFEDPKVRRKVVKRPVMTLPYGSGRGGFQQQIMSDTLNPYLAGLRAKWGKDWERHTAFKEVSIGKAASFLASLIDTACRRELPGPTAAMAYLKKTAKAIAEAGLSVQWTTPVGFRVAQMYKKSDVVRVFTTIAGNRVGLVNYVPTLLPDVKQQSQGCAPNFVHSLDAAHLQKTVVELGRAGIRDWCMIHDSYGTHAANTQALSDMLRHTFVETHETPALEEFYRQAVEQAGHLVQIEEPPKGGTFDLNEVLRSKYFFS